MHVYCVLLQSQASVQYYPALYVPYCARFDCALEEIGEETSREGRRWVAALARAAVHLTRDPGRSTYVADEYGVYIHYAYTTRLHWRKSI